MNIQLDEILLKGNTLTEQNAKRQFTVRVIVRTNDKADRYEICVEPNALADVGLGAALLQPSDKLDAALRGHHRALGLIVRAVSRRLRGRRVSLPLTVEETAEARRRQPVANPRKA